MRLPALSAALALLATLAATGCGGGAERSAQAYCDTYHDGFDEIKRQYPEVDQYSHSDNPVALLLKTTSALGDIIALIGEMADRAPDEVKSDTERVHETMQQQLDMVGSTAGSAASRDIGGLVGGLASSLMGGVANAGAFERMDRYVVANCGGEHMFAASPQ
jgi:hypothetical protein